jgi:hypothetical protein
MSGQAARSRNLSAAVIALLLVACGSHGSWAPREPSVDGWPLGTEDGGCGAPTTNGKPVGDLVAIASLKLPDPHPVITDVRCYLQGPYLSDGQLVVVKSTGGEFVVVFSFADGTRNAIGVGCTIGGCWYDEPYRERPRGVTLIPVEGVSAMFAGLA